MERVTTITAEQFIDQDYDDIVFNNQAVVTFGDLKVVDVTPRTDEFVMLWVCSERIGFDKVKVLKGEVLGVRWLDTAQTERDAAAMSNHDLKMWALNMENVDDKRVLLAIDRLITENASLQAELEATRKQLAAAVEEAEHCPKCNSQNINTRREESWTGKYKNVYSSSLYYTCNECGNEWQ